MSVSMTFQLKPFSSTDQKGVEELVLPIQQTEFGVEITREDQPDLMDVQGFFQHGNGNFWVAVDKDAVVGTIGLVDIGNSQVALRKMFVHKNYRGKEIGVANALLNGALDWCKERGVIAIFLGTTPNYLAAHRFYEKNGFVEVPCESLPASFPICHVDRKFYFLEIDLSCSTVKFEISAK